MFSDKVPAGKQSSRAPHDDAIDNSYLLRKQSDLLFKNDYDANRQLRRANRSERKNKLANEKERDALGLPSSVELLPVTDGDREAARQAFSGVTGVTSALASGASKNLDSVKRKARDGFDRDRQQNKRAAIRESSIFSGPGVLRGSGYAGTGKTVASSSVSLSQRTRAQKSDSVSYGVPGMSPVVTLFKNDYDANRQLRRANRSERKNKLANEKERDALGLPSSVELLPVTDGDREAARQAFSGVTGVTSALASGASKNLDSVKRKARDGFDRDRQQNKRAAIRESSIFSGPGVLRGSGYAGTGKTVASSSVSLSQRTRAQKSDSVSYGVPGMSPVVTRPKSNLFGKTSGEPFGVYSSPRSAAKGRGYVPTKFAAARAGGLRGVEARLAVVAASKEQRGGVSKKSNASRAVALVKRSSAKIGLARYPSVEYG